MKLTEVFELDPKSMSRRGFWAGRRGVWTHNSGSSCSCWAALPRAGHFPQAVNPYKQHLCMHMICVNHWRCSPSFSRVLPCPRAGGAGVGSVNPSAVSWALTSSSSAFRVVVLTQIIWDISWQPKFTHAAAPGPAVFICVSLCTPQACHCILGNVSRLAVRGSDWNCAKPSKERKKITCFFGWARKLRKS